MNQESRIMKQGLKKNKIKSFTDLDAWKEGHKLVLDIYKITKKNKARVYCRGFDRSHCY